MAVLQHVARALFPTAREITPEGPFEGSGSSSNTEDASLTSSMLGPSPNIWQIPLVGLSDTVTDPWGINITTSKGASLHPIVVSNSSPSVLTPGTGIQPNVVTIGQEKIGNNSLELGLNAQDELSLGNNSRIVITTASYVSIHQNATPTVPFGLNLGHQGSWNGVLVLGGDYDSNRVTGGIWNLVAESANGNGTFLDNGIQHLNDVTFKPTSTQKNETYSAVIDFNSEAIILPTQEEGDDPCFSGFSITLNTKSGQTMNATSLIIPIPSNLTTSSGRCTYSNTTTSKTVTLGRPFFQAAYIYVDNQSQIFLNPAHQNNLSPNPTPFNSSHQIYTSTTPPPFQPTSTSPSHSSYWKKHSMDILIGILGGAFGLIILFSLTLCFLRKQKLKKKHEEKVEREMENFKMHSRNLSQESNYSSSSNSNSNSRTGNSNMGVPRNSPVQQVSVFESDDENDSKVLKRTKTFLKGLRKGGGGGGKGEGKKGRVEGDGNRFEDGAWDHEHRVVYDVGVAIGDDRERI